MRKNVSITNKRVLEAYENAVKEGKGARFIEDAVLFYLDSIENEYVTAQQVREIIAGYLIDSNREFKITNSNLEMPTKNDIDDILNM